jgi:hypothetical protein
MKQCRQDETRWQECLDAHVVVMLEKRRYRSHRLVRAAPSDTHDPRTRNRPVFRVDPLNEEAVR